MTANCKYDDASWHSEGDFPADLPADAAATHIGMYLAWMVLKSFGSPELDADVGALKSRTISPRDFCLRECDGKIASEDFSDKGNRFAAWYYNTNNCLYYSDLEAEFGSELCGCVYYLKDNWETFDRLAKRIDARLQEFISA